MIDKPVFLLVGERRAVLAFVVRHDHLSHRRGNVVVIRNHVEDTLEKDVKVLKEKFIEKLTHYEEESKQKERDPNVKLFKEYADEWLNTVTGISPSTGSMSRSNIRTYSL